MLPKLSLILVYSLRVMPSSAVYPLASITLMFRSSAHSKDSGIVTSVVELSMSEHIYFRGRS